MSETRDSAPPTPDDVRAWVGVPETTITDEQLATVLAAERAVQERQCTVEPWNAALTQALYRRVGREVAAMGLPLGVSEGEYGTNSLPRFDAEIERLERPYRRTVLG